MQDDSYLETTTVDPNLTDTTMCAAKGIEGDVTLPFSDSRAIVVRGILLMYFVLIILFGTPLNILVIFLVAKFKKLQKPPYIFALQIVVLDLVLIAGTIPALVGIILNCWPFGVYGCALDGLVTFGVKLLRIFLMLVFTTDRIIYIFFPITYKKYDKKILVSLTVFADLFIISMSIIALPGILDCYEFSNKSWLCDISSTCKNCQILTNIFFYMIGAPTVVATVIHFSILCYKARKINRNPSSFPGRVDWNATITFFFLFLSLIFVIVPSAFAFVIFGSYVPRRPSTIVFCYTIKSASLNVVSFLVLVDPLVLLRNRDIREILSVYMDSNNDDTSGQEI